ncbi:MAG: PilT/PilU family type 4a pilus ATPase [Phycisphaerales bacterium]|nr:PilT/PilU family type 4a pilus ATPase [Phycisphaerales bacterium]
MSQALKGNSMQGEITTERLLLMMQEVQASDLHMKVGSAPVLRVAAKLREINSAPLTAEDTERLLMPIVPTHLIEQLKNRGGIDFSHTPGRGQRYRCSVFHAGGGLHAAIRRVNPTIPDFDELHLPAIYERVAEHTHEGLVVVCGVTGSGKSSTLAAIIGHMNDRHAYNIITVEDPVEYLFVPHKSYISQREIGLDVIDFPTALRAAVRQDPDVIMIGEMRDRETMMAGLMAAETGHLVFVTLHTADAMQSFARILEFFPSNEHNFIRSTMANGLQAVMAQRLLPSVRPGVKVVPATEVLLNTPVVGDVIREGRDEDLYAVMHGSAQEGMHTFTDSLARLVEEDWVDLKTAERYAPNAEALRSKVRGIKVKADVLVSRKS